MRLTLHRDEVSPFTMTDCGTIDETDLRNALATMSEGLQIIDREWRYLYVNDAAAEHGRRSKEELLGRTMMECYPGIEQTEMFEALTRCMKQSTNCSLENRFNVPRRRSAKDGSGRAHCHPGLCAHSSVLSGNALEREAS